MNAMLDGGGDDAGTVGGGVGAGGRAWSSRWTIAALAAGLVGLGVASRLIPHPPNFTPAASIALFAGFVFADRRLALGVMASILVASDLALGFYEPGVMAAVYAGLAFPVALRGYLRRGAGLGADRGGLAARSAGLVRTGIAALASSAVFFGLTNGAVWAFSPWYERSWAGLAECYAMALPFLKYTMAGDLMWSGALFGAHAAACRALSGARESVSLGEC